MNTSGASVNAGDKSCSISFYEMVMLMYREGEPNKTFLLTTLSWAVFSLIMMTCISNTWFLVFHNLVTSAIVLFHDKLDNLYARYEALYNGENQAFVEALHFRSILFIVIPNLTILLIGGIRLFCILFQKIWTLQTLSNQIQALGLKPKEKETTSKNEKDSSGKDTTDE